MDSKNNVIYANFNQDSSCLSVATETGFKIYSADPFKHNYDCDLEGGIGKVEMLYRSNIMALVGGGEKPKFDSGKVVIWDDQEKKIYNEISFSSNVLNVKMKKDIMLVATEGEINLYSFPDIENKKKFDTYKGIKGIMAVNGEQDSNIVAFPGPEKGSVVVANIKEDTQFTIPKAHDGEIAHIGISFDGSLIATCSEKGTLIRIFKTDKQGENIGEFRRGTQKADIFSLAFRQDNKFLACASDRGTIHIFGLNLSEVKEGKNTGSMLSFIPVSYFKSEWSFAQFKISESKSICAFAADNSILVLTDENKFYKATFDEINGGDCQKVDEEEIKL